MDNLYILDGKNALHCSNLMQWAEFMAQKDRLQVALTRLDGVTVSTVFLGVDYNNFADMHGDPLLFETLVFYGDGGLGSLQRYFTWAEAAEGHGDVVEAVRMEVERSVSMTDDVIASIRAQLLAGKT